jgi:hypothetical protein
MVSISFKKKRSKPANLEHLIQTLSNLDVSVDKTNDVMIIDKDEDETDVIQINASFQTELTSAIRTNDITKASQLLRDQAKEQYMVPEFDIHFFHTIGKYCHGLLYSILRNSNIFEDNLTYPFYFDAIIEGIAKTDNHELLKHMTNTHQLTLITEHKLGVYLQCFIEARAYICLECLTRFLSLINSRDSHAVMKEVFARGIETLDNRVVTIILKSMRPTIKH